MGQVGSPEPQGELEAEAELEAAEAEQLGVAGVALLGDAGDAGAVVDEEAAAELETGADPEGAQGAAVLCEVEAGGGAEEGGVERAGGEAGVEPPGFDGEAEGDRELEAAAAEGVAGEGRDAQADQGVVVGAAAEGAQLEAEEEAAVVAEVEAEGAAGGGEGGGEAGRAEGEVGEAGEVQAELPARGWGGLWDRLGDRCRLPGGTAVCAGSGSVTAQVAVGR